MFNKAPGIGLDIGSRKIKIAQVKGRKNSIQLSKFGSIATPWGAMEAGNILDVAELGQGLSLLVKDLNLKGKSVVAAVSGQQVYTRNIVMPKMKQEELKEAIYFQAMNFLPVSVDEVAIDFFPLRDFEDEEGKKTEIFFVAVRKQQVENLEEVCKIAGLKLAAVEIEPLAIHRILGKSKESGIKAFINIGASRSYFTVFKDGLLKFYRTLSFGTAAFAQQQNLDNGDTSVELDTIDIVNNDSYEYLVRDVIAEVNRSIEYYDMQNMEEKVESIILCGGGSRIKGLDERLGEGIGRQVSLSAALEEIVVPANISEEQKHEIQHDYIVALGLAARAKI